MFFREAAACYGSGRLVLDAVQPEGTRALAAVDRAEVLGVCGKIGHLAEADKRADEPVAAVGSHQVKGQHRSCSGQDQDSVHDSLLKKVV